MNPTDTTDRADATVWLPLLNILGGVAERVSRLRRDESQDGTPKSAVGYRAARGEEP